MSTFLSRIPRQLVDQDKAGDVYILVFKGDVPIRKMAHHALLVDVAGTTNDSYFSGVLLHLTANALDRPTEFRIDDRPWKRNILYGSVYIGKTVPANYVHMSQPRKWAIALQEFGHDVCDQLVDEQGNPTWSSKLNCQIFVKTVLQNFGFRWPTQLPFIEDNMAPTIIDLSLGFVSCKANKLQKKDKVNKRSSDEMSS